MNAMSPVDPPTLVVCSRYRWGVGRGSAGWRSQQLLLRLARQWRISFIEPPQPTPNAAVPGWRVDGSGVTVGTPPRLPSLVQDGDEWSPAQLAATQAWLAAATAAQAPHGAIGWLDTPLALPLLETLAPRCLVFDDLSALPADAQAAGLASSQLDALLARADLVLSPSPLQCELLRQRQFNVCCVPPAVDARSFEPCRLPADGADAIEAFELQAQIARPRLGCYGAIDERVDLALLAALADEHTDWQFVLAGAVADGAVLPRRANLHWLGEQPPSRLPFLLAGWDLCLLPLKVDGPASYAAPCEMLEYMAGEKPVVSTALADVAQLGGGEVHVAHSRADFSRACAALLAQGPLERVKRGARMTRLVGKHSWQRSAEHVRHAIELAAAHATEVTHLPQAMRRPPAAGDQATRA